LCKSDSWKARVEQQLLPWSLAGVDLGDRALEIGPGFGATTAVLARRVTALTAVELDPGLAARLVGQVPPNVEVIQGDGTSLPLPDGAFSAVMCFTMLHHIPAAALQDRLFAEAYRVVADGGVFVGTDSVVSTRFRILHIADTMVPVDPRTLPDRLRAAGFRDVAVSVGGRALRFRAYK
jgi:SAM-dependent methyltransferase